MKMPSEHVIQKPHEFSQLAWAVKFDNRSGITMIVRQ